MRPTNFPEAVKPIGKPADMKEEDCRSIHAYVGIKNNTVFELRPTHAGYWFGDQQLPSGDVAVCFITHWMPSEEEIRDILAGKGIYLSILSRALPPAALFTQNPFISNESKESKADQEGSV